MCQGLQVHHSICAIAIVGVEDQVPVEVSSVQSREGQSVAIASQGGFDRGQGGAGGGGEEIMEQFVGDVPGYSSSLSAT